MGASLDFFLFLIVTAGVFRISASENSHGHADNHPEPDQGERLKRHKEGQEYGFDGAVHTDRAINVLEGVKEVAPLVWVSVGSSHFRRGSRIATIRHSCRNFFVDGPAEFQIQDMASSHPSGHEETKGNIACVLVFEVLQNFCGLVWWISMIEAQTRLTVSRTGSKKSTISIRHNTTFDTL